LAFFEELGDDYTVGTMKQVYIGHMDLSEAGQTQSQLAAHSTSVFKGVRQAQKAFNTSASI
jgi:hypothetical protein